MKCSPSLNVESTLDAAESEILGGVLEDIVVPRQPQILIGETRTFVATREKSNDISEWSREVFPLSRHKSQAKKPCDKSSVTMNFAIDHNARVNRLIFEASQNECHWTVLRFEGKVSDA
jgi:hypothetical protein